MNRIYEEIFIIRPDATEEEIAPIIDQLKSTVTSSGGTIDKEERWGVRKLAYRVEKRNEGYYVLMQFTAGPQIVREVERRLRVNDAVLKYMTVRIDEKLKKIEKRKKQREKRAARRPAPQAAAPLAPAEGLMPSAPVPAGPTPGAPMPGAPVSEAVAAEALVPETPAAVATPETETQE
jgi:small subunit ribosomal protein S6